MNRPLSILFAADVPPDPSSGAAGTEYQTIQALKRLGHEVDALWAEDLGRHIKHGNLHYLFELPRTYRKAIRAATQQKQYDVYHVNQGHCYLAARDHRNHRRPGIFVFRSHGLDDHMERVLAAWRNQLGIKGRSRLKQGPGNILDRLLHRHISLACRNASGVLVSSSLDKEFLTRVHRVPPERTAAVPQAAPQNFLDTPPGLVTPERRRKILFIGSEYWKGALTVIQCVNKLAQQQEDFSLTWICSPEAQAAAVRQLDAAAREKISFPGWISQADLIKTYDAHGILLCPSLFEGFCKVFLEGMSRGLCVVGTPTGGMRDILQDRENGFLIGFDRAREMAECITGLWATPATHERISREARMKSLGYSWDRVAEESAAFYRALLDMTGRDPDPMTQKP